jgi:hypothetical protein
MDVLEARVKRTRKTTLSAAAALLAMVVSGVPAAGQPVAAPGLKAAYLYNFAQFVEWPAAVVPDGASLVLCIVNDRAVADVLAQMVKGRTVGGHDLTIIQLATSAPLPTCHVLYLAGLDLKRTLDVVEAVKGSFVFTVSDAEHFRGPGAWWSCSSKAVACDSRSTWMRWNGRESA